MSDTLFIAKSCNHQVAALLQNCILLLSRFETLLSETVSQESIINVLQFLAVEAIFLENQAKDKEAVITNQGIESLRVRSMGILRQVEPSLTKLMPGLRELPRTTQFHFGRSVIKSCKIACESSTSKTFQTPQWKIHSISQCIDDEIGTSLRSLFQRS